MFTTECVEDLAAQLIVREKAAVDAEAVSAKLQASFDGLVAAERDLQHAIEASERFDSTDSADKLQRKETEIAVRKLTTVNAIEEGLTSLAKAGDAVQQRAGVIRTRLEAQAALATVREVAETANQLKQRLEGKEAKDRRSQAADSGAALRRVNELAQQAEDSGGCGLPGCSQDGPCGAAKCPATDGTAALSIATSNEAVLSAETELARVVPEQQQQQQQREAEEAAAAAAAGGKDAPLGALWSALSAAASSMLGGGAAPPPPPIDLEEALLAAPHRSPLAPSILSRVLKRTQEQAKVCAGLSKSLRQARAAVEADLTAAKTALSAEAREERKKQKQPPLAPEEETRLQLVVQAANALLSDADAILAAADAWAGGRRLDQKPPAVLARTSELRPVAAAAVAANKGFQDTAAAVRSHLPAARLLLACARVSEAVETRERRCEAARDAARERARRAVLRQLREEEEQQAFTDETERGGGCGALGCTAMRTGSACNKTRCVAFECFEARVALRDGCGPLLAGESRLHAFAHIYTR